MKKVLSLTLALVMLLTSFSAVTAVSAKEQTPQVTAVETQIEKAAQFIINNTYDMNSLSYPDYWLLLSSGVDMSAYKDDYFARLKANLDKNDGKIIIEGTEWYQNESGGWESYSYSYEDISVYAAVIMTLQDYYEEDHENNPSSTDFYGYDITVPFESFDLSKITNPYSYRLAIEASIREGNNEYADTLVKDMILRFYTLGKGLDNWGYSCDNAGHFLTSLGVFSDCFGDKYKKYSDDAEKVIKSYTRENGAICDEQYAPDVNANSTALAMMGFAAMGDYDNAYWYYDKLISGFYNAETGAFLAPNYDTGVLEDNVTATKDALRALGYYKNNLANCHTWEQEVIKPATCTQAGLVKLTCKACGATKTELIDPSHSLDYVAAKAASPVATGNKAYYSCSACGKAFKDAGATQETTVEAETIAKTAKYANTLTVKGKTATFKAKSLKKKAQTIDVKKALAVSKAQGKVTYAKKSGNKKITVNKKTGKITVKKGLKKGTYKVYVKVTAAGNAYYKASAKTVKVTIKVK